MQILGFDPGGSGNGTTGRVNINVDRDSLPTLIEAINIPNGGDRLDGIYDSLHITARFRFGHPDVLAICERFIPRKGAANIDCTPLLIEGAIRVLFRDVILQREQERLIITDEHLKKLGWYDTLKGGNHHDAKEAARHVLAYLIKNGHKPTLELLFPKED